MTISVLTAAFVLLGLGGMFWAVQSGPLFGPTPTPTATRQANVTATPDFGATRVAQDFATQQAFQAARLGTPPATPTPNNAQPAEELTATPTPLTVLLPGLSVPMPVTPGPGQPAALLPTSPLAPPSLDPPTPPVMTSTVAPNNVGLPIIVGDSPLPTPTGQLVAVLPTPVAPPLDQPPPSDALPTSVPPLDPSPVPSPTPVPPVAALPTDTPPATLTPPPSEPPTATPTPEAPTVTPPPTPTTALFQVSSLRGVFADQGATRIGPSSIYSFTTGSAPRGQEVRLLGRTPSGEWVYFCCLENSNEPAWTRQVYAPAEGNPREANMPDDFDANDVRRLPIQPALPSLPPLPQPVPIGPNDFTLPRVDPPATGRVPSLPTQPFTLKWKAQTGQALTSAPAVFGNSVLVASADGHLYSFDRNNGSQRWRVNLNAIVRQAPIVYEGEIFVAAENNTLYAFEDRGNGAAQIWSQTYDGGLGPAVTSFNIYSDTLFIAVASTASEAFHSMLMVDRDNGTILRTEGMSGPGMRYPAIGDQLVYIANGFVQGMDVFANEVIWKDELVNNITAGPVYSAPGVRDLAELYLVDGNNRIFCLDANNGSEIWNGSNDEPATSLAINADTLFVAGNGYLKAISRQDFSVRWRTAVAGQALGGPLVDGGRVLVLTQSGTVQLFDGTTGAPLAGSPISAAAAAGPAVSGALIFVPGTDGQLYALEGIPQAGQ
jgi:outer membrane protein assembly factor BamB